MLHKYFPSHNINSTIPHEYFTEQGIELIYDYTGLGFQFFDEESELQEW